MVIEFHSLMYGCPVGELPQDIAKRLQAEQQWEEAQERLTDCLLGSKVEVPIRSLQQG